MCSDMSMEYETFKENLLQELRRRVDKRISIQIRRTLKNNGIYQEGLFMTAPNLKVSPNFYLEQFYSQYLKTGNWNEIVEEMLSVFQSSAVGWNPNMDFFKDFAYVKERLAFKLIHFEENRALLQQMPFRRYLDLAIVYYCFFEDALIQNGMINVMNMHLQMWGVTEEELYQAALENAPSKLPAHIMKMADMIGQPFDFWSNGFWPETETQIEMFQSEQSLEFHMYILTNSHKLFGAVVILYPKLLQRLSNILNSDLYIMPSSVHEGATRFAA